MITKLASILSASISLAFGEKMVSVMNKLDSIVNFNKIMQKRLTVLENENVKLEQENSTFHNSVRSLYLKVDQMDHLSKKNNTVITGVAETFAELN